jgi:hypothetical protein
MSTFFAAGVVALSLCTTIPELSQQRAANSRLAYSSDALTKAVSQSRPAAAKGRPVYFSDEQGQGSQMVMDLQFTAGGEWYTLDSFSAQGGGGGGFGPMGAGRGGPGGPGGFGGPGGPGGGAGQPTVFDPQRQKYTQQLYSHLSSQDLIRRQTAIVRTALDQSRPVYAILSVGSVSQFKRQLASEGFVCTLVTSGREPALPVDATGFGGPGGRGGRAGGGRGGPGGFGGPGGPGGFGGGGGFGGPGGFGGGRGGFGGPGGGGMGMDSVPQTLQVLQITAKPAA